MPKRNPLFHALFALAIQTAVLAQPGRQVPYGALKNTVILIIRHAEKARPSRDLAPAGVARAKAYVDYFGNYRIDGKPVKLGYLFATADTPKSRRPRLTLEPLSKATGLVIDTRFIEGDAQGLADEMHARPHGPAILVAWHHGEIARLLDALGADPGRVLPNGRWPEPLYDRLVQLRFDGQGRLLEARGINENLMPGDSPQ
ncbi:MAG: hypothetical protein P4L36_05300 [Holophaga sp.]|nr:hypothetical protein [Holophaga sp.]